MHTLSTDGKDVVSVLKATRALLTKVRSGEGPALLEARTTRWRGHFEGDPQKYRPREELESMTARDPLKVWASQLHEQHAVTGEDLDRLDAAIQAEVVAVAKRAEALPPSDPRGLTRFVYPEAVDS
jgi:pyruvate dehydrogenase E1 component alpha subunit